MTNTNRALWDRVCMTDPKAVKEITGKQYKGNSPKPYWIVERLTEEFGPCGFGWGFTIANERMERLTPDDVLHVAVVDFWYMLGDKKCHVQQIGQTKAVYKTRNGILVDEDAPKKSVTDALVKCASYIGFAGDIFAGRWDDSKYVAQANAEYRAKESEANASPADKKALEDLQNAAMEGSNALRDKFTAMSKEAEAHPPTKEWFAGFWKHHSGALKMAAAKADADRNAFLSEEGDR